MEDLRKSDVLQLERKGYYIVDVPAGPAGQPAVLFSIPDGHQKKPAAVAPAARPTGKAKPAAAAGSATPPEEAPKAAARIVQKVESFK